MKRVLCATLGAAATALEKRLNKRAGTNAFTVKPLRDETGWVEVVNTASGRRKRVKMQYTLDTVDKRTYIPWDHSYSINSKGEAIDSSGNKVGSVCVRVTLDNEKSTRRNYSPKGDYDVNSGFIDTVDSNNAASLDRLIRSL